MNLVPDRILNEQLRPRIVVHVEDPGLRAVLEVLESWPGTITHAHAEHVHWREHDLLITDTPPIRIHPFDHDPQRFVARNTPVFHLLQYHPDYSPVDVGQPNTIDLGSTEILTLAVSGGAQLMVPEDVDAEVNQLIRQSLYPELAQRMLEPGHGQWGVKVQGKSAESPIVVHPFVRSQNRVMLAGTYRRGVDGVTNYVVPADADPIPWIKLALRRWAQELPDQFPSAPDWQHSDTWTTPAEHRVRDRIDAANVALEQAKAEHALIVGAAETELDGLRAAADVGPRRLLTDDGETLVAAVAEALAVLGFTVHDMDGVYPEGERHEDLQIRETVGDWIALVEVTGTLRGVQQEKWRKLHSHLTAYLRRPHAARSAVPWLVVNQERQAEPDARADLWQASFREEIADQRGLGIESPALFVLANRVQAGDLDRTRARAALREATGVFTLAQARSTS